MNEIMIGVYDHATGENIVRKANQDELEIMEKSRLELKEKQEKQDNQALARQSALTKLAALGLTEDEIAAL